jgi:hypothetical protein
MKIQKIIAREGLILIGIMIAGSVFFFGGKYCQNKLETKTYFTLTKEQIDKMEGKGRHIFALSDEEFISAIGLSREQRKEIEREWRRDRFLSFLSRIAKAAGIFLISAGFPLHLLTRFIFWALRMQKEKPPKELKI